MSFNQNTDDLRAEALWRAGEPQDSNSSFWVKSLDYLNRVQQGLVMGGGVAVGRDLATSAGIYSNVVLPPITDWPWARKRGVITTTPAIETGTVTLVNGSPTVTFSSAPTLNVTGWRLTLIAMTLPTAPRINQHTPGSTTATMDAPWPEDSQTAVSYSVYQHEYALPDDFLRFTAPLQAHATWGQSINVLTQEQFDPGWPGPWGSLLRKLSPSRAYLIPGSQQGTVVVAFNSYDTRSYRLEFEYIAMPAALQSGTIPILPPHYRPVLAIGAAMLMCFDKGDDRAKNLASEFREMTSAMVQEWRRAQSGGSSMFGQFRFRQHPRAIRSIQPMGELFFLP